MRHADLLEDLLQGEALPDADAPDGLDELAMLADLIADSAVVEPVVMRAEARNDIRNQLIRHANQLNAQPPPLLTRVRDAVTGRAERFAYSSRAALAGGTAAMVLSTGGMAAAATNSLPGDLFYGLKLAGEDVALSFADPGVPRGTGLLDQAWNRLEEAATAAERDEQAVSADAMRLADEHTRDGAQEYLTVYLDGGDTAVLGELGDWVVATHERLDEMPEVSGPAIDALADLRTSLNRIGQRIEVLTTGACVSCALGVHDDPEASETTSRGTEADGTPPLPAGAPVDLTYIPRADLPFQACPCVTPAPAGSAVPAPAPTEDKTEPPPQDPNPPPQSGPPPSNGGGGDPGGGEDPGGGSPLPDPGPITEPLPDPVREAIEEVIDQIPDPPSETGTAVEPAPDL